MQISDKLPQFIDDSALLLVAGSQEADFYLAKNGEILAIGSVVLEKNHYSDREDFGRRGSIVFESGSKSEKVKTAKRSDFLKLFKEYVKGLSTEQKVKKVYLYAPAENMADLKKALPAAFQKKLLGVFEGNFHKEKPFDILKKIIKKPLK